MLQPRLRGTAASARDHNATLNHLAAAFNTLTFCPKHTHLKPQISSVFVRHASHAAQGRANGPGDSAGRRLGAKKTASQYVIPGNIIFKQRGTKWFPGENVDMGRDHTIYSTQYGYVRYYKNPALHPKRQYIGVALEKEGPGSMLPTPANAPTRRRLGMYETPINGQSDEEFLQGHLSENSKGPKGDNTAENPVPTPPMKPVGAGMIKTYANRPGMPWPTNYEIGKAGERNAALVRPFDRKDRWLAWRKRSKKVKEGMLARAAKATRKTKGKKSNKGGAIGKK